MAAYKSAVVAVLTELVVSHDEKPCLGKTRKWIKRRKGKWLLLLYISGVKGWRPNGLQRYVPHECQWLWVLIKPNIWPHSTEWEDQWKQVCPIRRRIDTDFKTSCYRWFYQSPSYQLRMSLVVASLHCKGCCTVINDKLQNMLLNFQTLGKVAWDFQKIWATLELPTCPRCFR